jgi:hypothetical protein
VDPLTSQRGPLDPLVGGTGRATWLPRQRHVGVGAGTGSGDQNYGGASPELAGIHAQSPIWHGSRCVRELGVARIHSWPLPGVERTVSTAASTAANAGVRPRSDKGLLGTPRRAERLYGQLVLARVLCRSRQQSGGDGLAGDELAAAMSFGRRRIRQNCAR